MLSSLLSRKFAIATAVAIAAWGAASSAHARTDVFVSIGIQVPGVHVQAAPVYIPPRHVYVQPRPVYVQPRHVIVQPAPVYYVQPHPVFIQPPTHGYHYKDKGRHGWRAAPWERAHHARGHQGHRGKHGKHDRH